VSDAVAGRVRGCLLGGAVGDALGAPVEFVRRKELERRFGEEGVRAYVEDGGIGRITDDTQMTLFTAEGLIRSRVRAVSKGLCHEPTVIDHAYARWLETQGGRSGRWQDYPADGWLVACPELQVRRAPGVTCESALRAPKAGTIEAPINDSKGCGGVMRMAPIGLVPEWEAEARFQLGAEAAALTHGHPSGYLAAGFLAAMIGALLDGEERRAAARAARGQLVERPDHEEVLRAVDAATECAAEHGLPSPEQIDEFGEGWVAEEALGIALWAALAAEDFLDGVSASVTHSGDSDSTGAIAGNILGAALGEGAIPAELIDGLAERDVVEAVADDVHELLGAPRLDVSEELWERYPGV
jgi:ADP-ribosylglycohydrolase